MHVQSMSELQLHTRRSIVHQAITSNSMHPSIEILPPVPGISRDHHYIPPPKSSYLPSIPYITTPIKKPVAGPAPVPYFQNPWPSYRSASLSDVYTAYMKGAEIALPRQDGKETEQLMSESVQESGHGGRDRQYKDIDEQERVEDDEEDWREPPVDVKETDGSIWDESSETESVTWLGHAGVLLQLPWRKGKGQQGMCNILFDPIFSYRSVCRNVAKLIRADVRLPSGSVPLATFLHPARSLSCPPFTFYSSHTITVSALIHLTSIPITDRQMTTSTTKLSSKYGNITAQPCISSCLLVSLVRNSLLTLRSQEVVQIMRHPRRSDHRDGLVGRGHIFILLLDVRALP
jgi:hypothetical protein